MDELISRRVAIDAINSYFGFSIEEEYGSAVQEVINGLPSAQSERKTGRWEYVDYGGFGNWHCTACRQICICNGDYDFCPNCGADMRGGNDETD